jgi:hypothetical protein
MESWIDQGRHLAALAHYLHFTESTPTDLVAKVGHKAIEVRDRMAAMGILGAIIARQLLLLVMARSALSAMLLWERYQK